MTTLIVSVLSSCVDRLRPQTGEMVSPTKTSQTLDDNKTLKENVSL